MVENNKSIFEKFSDKITFENKRIFGAILIILGIIFLLMSIDNPLFLILAIIPGIGLCIPKENIKNSKLLGIMFIVLMIVLLVLLYSNYTYFIDYYFSSSGGLAANYAFESMEGSASLTDYVPIDYILPYILAAILYIYGIFVSLLYFIETKSKKVIDSSDKSIDLEETNFCKHCGNKIEKDTKFCPSCGKEI